jgi:transposase
MATTSIVASDDHNFRSTGVTQSAEAPTLLSTTVDVVRNLTRQFLGLMHRRRPREFDAWLKRPERCGVTELERLAASLRSDLPAVRAAFKLPRSNGQTEGHVNRLKFLKRQMYGRASIDLLRLRVLNPN